MDRSSRTQIFKGDLFIVEGQKALVADTGQWFTPEHGERDRRLRVIFDNGTESDLLLRSLQTGEFEYVDTEPWTPAIWTANLTNSPIVRVQPVQPSPKSSQFKNSGN